MKRKLIAALFVACLFLPSATNAQLGLPASIPFIKGGVSATVTIPCDLTTCIACYGMRLCKTAAAHAFDLKGNDATTTTINFSGKYADTATATSFCTTHGSPCKITKIYDQIGTQDCIPTGGEEPLYDSSITINSIPTIKLSNVNSLFCQATLSSGATSGTVVSTQRFLGTNNAAVWAHGASANVIGLRTTSTTVFEAFEYNFSTIVTNDATVSLPAINTALVTFSASLIHFEVNGVATSDTGGQAQSSETAFLIGAAAGGNFGDGNIADVILLAQSTPNGQTVACSEKTAWAVSVSGC